MSVGFLCFSVDPRSTSQYTYNYSSLPVKKKSILFGGVKIVSQRSDLFIFEGIRSSLCLRKKSGVFFLIFRLPGALQWQFGSAQVARALDFLCIHKGNPKEIQRKYKGVMPRRATCPEPNCHWGALERRKSSKTLQNSSLGKVKT